MTDTTAHRSDFFSIFGIPAFLAPWVDRFFEPGEIELVLALADGPQNGDALKIQLGRGAGESIDQFLDRAWDIIRDANKKGLMQSGEIQITANGKIDGAICNCCADCCYPHLLATQMAAEKLWPLSRYEARLLADRCTGCGRCIRRCSFGAVELVTVPHGSEAGLVIRFNRDLCRGCGLCATGCPEAAIEMALTGEALRF